jgi:two-component system, NarL family, sensor kinase
VRCAVVLALALVLPVLWVVTSRLTVPSDGTLHYFERKNGSPPGVVLAWASRDGPLRSGDVVVAIGGRPVAQLDTSWAGAAGPLTYTVVRGGRTSTVPVSLGPYPLVETVQRAASALALILATMVVAVVVFLRRPHEPAARALLAVCVLLGLGATSWPFGPQVVDLARPFGWWPYLLGSVANTLLWGAMLHLALTTPRPLPLVRRHPALVPAAYALPFVLYAVAATLRLPSAADPLGRLQILLHVSLPAARTVPAVLVGLLLVGLAVAPDRDERRRVAGVLATLCGCSALYLALGQLPHAFGSQPVTPPWLALVFLPLPLVTGAAVLRRRLFDVQLVLRRSLVYAVLTGILALLYVAVLLALQVGPQSGPPPLAALIGTGLVALAFHPLRTRLQRLVGRRLFGDRVEPGAVTSKLDRVELVGVPDEVLGRIVRTLVGSLRLRYAAVELSTADAGVVVRAEHGVRDQQVQRVPLLLSGHHVGWLLVATEPAREAFGPADSRLLDEVTRQLSAVGYALLLTGELQRSRERLVMAREEERRRLRRDLHDGLGPTLAATAMNIEVAQGRVRSDPEGTEALLGRLLVEARQAVADVRRLGVELRPPALDELGLVEAIRERATYFTRPLTGPGSRTRVVVEAEGDFDSLPAAVEVAALRIALEGVRNAARHANAQTCRVSLRVGEVLAVDIVDDGCGLSLEAPQGVGLTSMRERAAEVGGTFAVDTTPGGGTTVRVRLPLGGSPAAGTVPSPLTGT